MLCNINIDIHLKWQKNQITQPSLIDFIWIRMDMYIYILLVATALATKGVSGK